MLFRSRPVGICTLTLILKVIAFNIKVNSYDLMKGSGQMEDRTALLLTSSPGPLLLKMATPNALAFMIQSAVSLAEIWFIGRLGTGALAGIALAFPLLMLIQTMSGGATGGAVTSAIARALGAGDRDKAQQ